MKQKFIETGKIVGTHGVKGMLRVQPWADSGEFLQKFKYFYLDKEGQSRLEATSVKPHGNVVLMALKGVNSIEDAERLRNRVIYISREDIKLPKDRYFLVDLIGCHTFDADTNEPLGVLSEVSETGANDVWHIKRGDKEYLVPAIDEVIVSVDIDEERIMLRPMKGIFDDED